MPPIRKPGRARSSVSSNPDDSDDSEDDRGGAAGPRGRRNSTMNHHTSKLTNIGKDAAKAFGWDDSDSVIIKNTKLSLLEQEFSELCANEDELGKLWADVDINDSGDVGLQEWQHFVRDRYQVIAHKKPTILAFKESCRSQEEIDADNAIGKADAACGGETQYSGVYEPKPEPEPELTLPPIGQPGPGLGSGGDGAGAAGSGALPPIGDRAPRKRETIARSGAVLSAPLAAAT